MQGVHELTERNEFYRMYYYMWQLRHMRMAHMAQFVPLHGRNAGMPINSIISTFTTMNGILKSDSIAICRYTFRFVLY